MFGQPGCLVVSTGRTVVRTQRTMAPANMLETARTLITQGIAAAGSRREVGAAGPLRLCFTCGTTERALLVNKIFLP